MRGRSFGDRGGGRGFGSRGGGGGGFGRSGGFGRGGGGGFRERRDDFDKPKPVKVGEERTVKITDVGAKGDGIAKIDDFIIFVAGAQKGEECKVRIKEVARRFAIAEKIGAADSSEESVEDSDKDMEETEEEKEDEGSEMDEVEEEEEKEADSSEEE